MKRIRNNKGETIVESLCAIMIVAVVVAFLSQAIAAAARSNRQVADSDRSFSYDDQQAVDSKLTITVFSGWRTGAGTDGQYYDVDEYVTQSSGDDPAPYLYRWYGFGGGRQ